MRKDLFSMRKGLFDPRRTPESATCRRLSVWPQQPLSDDLIKKKYRRLVIIFLSKMKQPGEWCATI